MSRRSKLFSALALLAILIFAFYSLGNARQAQTPSGYEDLAKLFREWREFQKPKFVNAVPDYSPSAMNEQRQGLKKFQQRLAAIDCKSWPIPQQVDWHLVRAEMNGLDFDHRVMRPWSRDPCFYVVITSGEPDVPAREGPEIPSVIEPWKMTFPIPEKDLPAFQAKLQAVPRILEAAKKNLTEDAKDLWFMGIRVKSQEAMILENLGKRLKEMHPALVPDVEKAKAAVDDFRGWLETKHAQMKAPSGIGVENYNWYLKNVHLVPYTWQDQVNILNREWERAVSSLKFEEHRNRNLPKLEFPKTNEEAQARREEAVKTYMDFLRNDQIFTVPDYMHLPAVRGRLVSGNRPWDVWNQIELRDYLPMRCHDIHWLEKLRLVNDPSPSPIRSQVPLYNIWDYRSEGLATAWEELMMNAGLFDKRPRARELIYFLVALRCARGIGDLRLHSNELNLDEAIKTAVDRTPFGWLRSDGETVFTDLRIYLHQPGYGPSYIVGKIHLDKLIADKSAQMVDSFTLKKFWDEFFTKGVIPISLIRWEMTGLDDEIKKLW